MQNIKDLNSILADLSNYYYYWVTFEVNNIFEVGWVNSKNLLEPKT